MRNLLRSATILVILLGLTRTSWAVCTGTYAETVLGLSPTYFACMNETSGTSMIDYSGNDTIGTYSVAVGTAPVTSVAGMLSGDSNTAISFAGTGSQYIATAVNNTNTANTSMTIVFWFKSTGAVDWAKVVSETGETSGTTGMEFLKDGTGSNPDGRMRVDTSTAGNQVIENYAVHAFDGNRHMIAFGVTGSTSFLSYDANTYVTGTISGTYTRPTVNLKIGNTAGWDAQPGTGTYQMLAIFPGQLTQGQLTTLYNAGTTISPTPTPTATATPTPTSTPTPTATPTPTPGPITLVGLPTNTSPGCTSNVMTINYPAGHVSGDVAYAYVLGSLGMTITGSRTWVTIGSPTSTGGAQAYLLRRVLDGSENADTFETFTGSGVCLVNGGMRVYAGVNNATPEDPNGPQYGNDSIIGTAVSVPGFTTTVAGDELVFFYGSGDADALSATLPSVDASSFGNPSANFDAIHALSYDSWDFAFGAAGPIGTVATTLGAAAHWMVALVALEPAPAATPTPTATATSTPVGTGYWGPFGGYVRRVATTGTITPTNCPSAGILVPLAWGGGELCSVNGGPITCPTSTNWINPMNAPYNAAGNGITNDAAAIAAATAAGDVCFPSGHTFLINPTVDGPAISTSVSNKHWQAGMIGGAAPIIKQGTLPSNCVGNGSFGTDQCIIFKIIGPTSGSITGDSVIGLDWEGTNTGTTPGYNQWDLPLRAVQDANSGLYAGNTFNHFWGDGDIELTGSFGGAATPCIKFNHVAYNTFRVCGGYGAVIIAGQNNTFDHNVSTDCAEAQENDDALECAPTTSGLGNLFDRETVTEIKSNGCDNSSTCSPGAACGVFLSNGNAGGANYSGNTVSNSAVSGTAVPAPNTAPSCLGIQQGTRTLTTCTGGCVQQLGW